MKSRLAVIIALGAILSARGETVELTPGALGRSVAVDPDVRELTVKGVVDATDLHHITVTCRRLETLDLSGAEIAACVADLPLPGRVKRHEANTLPAWCLAGLTASKVIFPASMTAIARGAMMSSAVSSVVIPASVRRVGEGAFADCRRLESVSIEGMATIVEPRAFSGCSNLQTVNYQPEAVAERCFSRCPALHTVELGSGVVRISDGAFEECHDLTEMCFPASLEEIGADTFAASGLREALLASTRLSLIGDRAFAGCASLQAVTLPAELARMGEAVFFDACHLTEVSLPGSLPDVPAMTFKGAAALTDVAPVLPESAAKVGTFSFAGMAGVTDLILPEAISHIATGAMSDWESLRLIDARSVGSVPALGEDVWEGIDKSRVTLLADPRLAGEFASAPQWSEFSIVTSALPSTEVSSSCGLEAYFEGKTLRIKSAGPLRWCRLYDPAGRCVARVTTGGATEAAIDTSAIASPYFILETMLASGGSINLKLRR